MAGNGIVINISGSGEGAAEALRQIEAKMQETADKAAARSAEIAAASDRIGESFERATPRVAAASGAIREFEGNLPIRAVERFLTDTLHMGPILQAAFPLIGGIAFAEMLVHIGEEIKKTMDASNGAAEHIRTEWLKANNELQVSSDALETKIDRTIAETDKLIGHTGANNLRVQFDESREAADRLGISISADLEKMQKLLEDKESHVGGWSSLFTGKANTGDSEALIKKAQQGIAKTLEDYNDVVSRAGESGNRENLEQAQVSRINGLQRAYDEAASRISQALRIAKDAQDTYEASGKTFGKDETANIHLLSGALRNLAEQERNIGEQYADGQATAKKTSVGDGGKKAEEMARRNAEVDAEIARKDAEDAKQELARLEQQSAARLRLQEATDNARLQLIKSNASVEIAEAEAQHNAGIISEQQFLQKKLSLLEGELTAEQASLKAKAADIQKALNVEGDSGTPREYELKAQLVTVTEQLAALDNERKKDAVETAAAIERQMEAQKQVGLKMLDTGVGKDEDADWNKSEKSKKTMADQVTSSTSKVLDQLAVGATKGKMNFKDMVDSIIADMERLAIKILAERWIGPAIQSMFGLGGPAGNGYSSPSEIANAENIAGAFAGGGEIPDGGMAIVGDGGDGSGSELFAPKGPGTVLPHDVLEGIAKGGSGGGGGAPNVIVNNVNNSSSAVSMKQTGVSWDSDAKQFVINTMLEDMQSGGPTAAAMRGMSGG